MPASKIATCCYCGTRAALVMRGAVRHELSCSACGAPLQMLKSMPVASAAPRAAPQPARAAHAAPPRPLAKAAPKPQRRKGKSLGRKIFSELWDVIEDVFD